MMSASAMMVSGKFRKEASLVLLFLGKSVEAVALTEPENKEQDTRQLQKWQPGGNDDIGT